MKILGEKSLSSKVIIGLKILFTIISLMNVVVISLIIKVVQHIGMKEEIQIILFSLAFYIMVIITGIIALFIVYQFIKIFKNLKDNVLFCENNSKSLNAISNSCFIISLIYLIITILILLLITESSDAFTYYILAFAIILMVVFVVLGIGIKILNEIYKKAIEYKEENDFTI